MEQETVVTTHVQQDQVQQDDLAFAKDLFKGNLEEPKIEPVVQPVTEPVTETNEPPVTEPVVEPTVPEVKTEPDHNSWLKEQLGYESAEAAKTALQTLAAREQELSNKLKELEGRPTFKTDFGKVADELHAKGVKPETIARFHGLNVQEMGALDKVKLDMQVNNPKLNAADIDAYLHHKYDTTDETLGLTDGEKAARKIELEQAAANAGSNLEKYVYNAFNPQPQVDTAGAQKEAERLNYWQQNGLKQLNSEFNLTLPSKMKLQGAQGIQEVANDFNFKLSSEASQAIEKELGTLLAHPANASFFTPDETGINNARVTRENLIWSHYGKEIIKEAMKHVNQTENKLHEHYATLLHNPTNRTVQANVTPVTNQAEQANKNAAQWLAGQS